MRGGAGREGTGPVTRRRKNLLTPHPEGRAALVLVLVLVLVRSRDLLLLPTRGRDFRSRRLPRPSIDLFCTNSYGHPSFSG